MKKGGSKRERHHFRRATSRRADCSVRSHAGTGPAMSRNRPSGRSCGDGLPQLMRQAMRKEIKMTLDIKLPEGFELIGNYNNQYVIAKNEHPGAPEPYVVWAVDYDKRGVHSGTYFPSLQMAQLSFCERAFGTNLMQDHESTEEHLLYAVTNDDIKAAVKAVRTMENKVYIKVPRGRFGVWKQWVRAIVQIEKILQQQRIPYELCGEYYGKEFKTKLDRTAPLG